MHSYDISQRLVYPFSNEGPSAIWLHHYSPNSENIWSQSQLYWFWVQFQLKITEQIRDDGKKSEEHAEGFRNVWTKRFCRVSGTVSQSVYTIIARKVLVWNFLPLLEPEQIIIWIFMWRGYMPAWSSINVYVRFKLLYIPAKTLSIRYTRTCQEILQFLQEEPLFSQLDAYLCRDAILLQRIHQERNL